MSLFPRRRFYRGGFRLSGLQALWSHKPISISCNVALGEPSSAPALPPQWQQLLAILLHNNLPPEIQIGQNLLDLRLQRGQRRGLNFDRQFDPCLELLG